MKLLKIKGKSAVNLCGEAMSLKDINSLEDYLYSYRFAHKCEIFIIDKTMLDFLDPTDTIGGYLSILKKCQNYNVKLVVVGDYTTYHCPQFEDLQYRLNNGYDLFLVSSIETGIDLLKGVIK